MPLDVFIALGLTVSSLAYALLLGGAPERWTAVVLSVGFLIDRIYIAIFEAPNFLSFNPHLLSLDVAVFVPIALLSFRANRVWPLFLAAFQLISLVGHLSAHLSDDGMQRAYWAMTQLPFLLQLVVLLIGVSFHSRRRKRIGNYRSWRAS